VSENDEEIKNFEKWKTFFYENGRLNVLHVALAWLLLSLAFLVQMILQAPEAALQGKIFTALTDVRVLAVVFGLPAASLLFTPVWGWSLKHAKTRLASEMLLAGVLFALIFIGMAAYAASNNSLAQAEFLIEAFCIVLFLAFAGMATLYEFGQKAIYAYAALFFAVPIAALLWFPPFLRFLQSFHYAFAFLALAASAWLYLKAQGK